MSEHPQDLSLRAQADAIATGELDATELLESTLARIEERDSSLNSIADTFGAESARMLAEAPEGPLHGVPIAIKDQFSLPWRAPRDGAYKTPSGIGTGESALYRRLRDAGAAIVAVTNMHEFGLGSTGHISIYGPCGNPWNAAHCAGGSSGGSASSVGARLVAGAVGTDGGGSVRFPSAYCGVTGLKLTWGRLPTDGFTLANHSVTAPGPICRDAADARLLGEAMLAQPLERRPAEGLRIGIPTAQLWNDLHPDAERACSAALDVMRGWGAEVKEISIAGVEHALISAVLALSLEVLPATKPDAAVEIAPHLSPLISALTKAQLLMPAVALVKGDRVRSQLRRSLVEAFAQVDALAWPAIPAPAPPIEDPTVTLPSGNHPADFANVRLGGIANLAGVPAMSIPCGFSGENLPLGIQLLAPWGEDARLLDIAELFERETERRYVDAVPHVAQEAAA
jgi:Asp-tRNA(Asn)/Glu-tRNA(Gln) amidotransferase A subunit family amidase